MCMTARGGDERSAVTISFPVPAPEVRTPNGNPNIPHHFPPQAALSEPLRDSNRRAALRCARTDGHFRPGLYLHYHHTQRAARPDTAGV